MSQALLGAHHSAPPLGGGCWFHPGVTREQTQVRRKEVSCSRARGWLSGRAVPGSLAPESVLFTTVPACLPDRGRSDKEKDLDMDFKER